MWLRVKSFIFNEWVSEWLLINTNSAMFQQYHCEKKLIFKWDDDYSYSWYTYSCISIIDHHSININMKNKNKNTLLYDKLVVDSHMLTRVAG